MKKTGGFMTNKTFFKDGLILIGLSAVMTIFITYKGFSQDSTKSKGEKGVLIIKKILDDQNGNRKEIDTTINLDPSMKPGDEQKIIDDFEKKLNDETGMMQKLQVELNEMKIPDSGFMDSIQGLTDKAMKMHRFMGSHFRNSPRAFNYSYNFDMPEMDQSPQIEEFEDNNPHSRIIHDRFNRSEEKNQSLNDLLGDIPMDMVKSYSIKETKTGKKITIELKNGPIIENHTKVIIMRDPRPHGRPGQAPRPQMRRKVIIHQDQQNQEDEENQNDQDKL
jgi:hypothetical protein